MSNEEHVIDDDGGIDDFISESKGGGGGGRRGNYLKSWSKNISEKPARGEIRVWLHPRGKLLKRWSHTFYRLNTFKEKTTVRMTRFNSMESTEVCRAQYFLDNAGNRETPPQICPFALTLEWVRQQVRSGKIGWMDKIFAIGADVEGVDQKTVEVVYAGGWIGLFDSKEVKESKDKLKELSKAGIRVDNAYRQKGFAQMQWVLSVVDDDKSEDGAKIATESKTLGDKFGEAIDKHRKALENPSWSPIDAVTKTKQRIEGEPVLFLLEHDSSKPRGMTNSVTVLPKAEPSDEVLAAFEQDPPDTSEVLAQSNVAQLRAWFEEYWCHKIVPPWNELFAKAMERVKGTPAAELPEEFNPDNMGGGSTSTTAAEDDDKFVACDRCDKAMPADATKCPNCGAEYEVDKDGNFSLKPDAPKEETPAPRLPKRRTQAQK